MDRKVIDDLLGEFSPHLGNNGGGNINHVVKTELSLVESYIALGKPEEAEKHIENIKRYVAALRGLPEFRKRELAVPVPKECLIDSSDNRNYIERAYAQLEEEPESPQKP